MNQEVEKFEFTPRLRRTTFILMGIGSLALVTGIILALTGNAHWSMKIWSNLLTNNMYFLGLALAGLLMITSHYLGLGGWYVTVKRVAEAMSMFIPVAGLLMLAVVIGLWVHGHHLYHWADAEAVSHDAILKGKSGYLNVPFWTFRYLVYFGVWSVLAMLIRKYSLNEDIEGGLRWYRRSRSVSAIFIAIFFVTSSTMAWDFIMSIDPHWYSTLFGWYTFSSYFVAGFAAIIVLVLFLKSKGLLQNVTEEHLHDLGKFMFAFSVFWAYLWFSQYMLIWYGNLGEETIYFKARLHSYQGMFFLNLFINFFVPFFALMRARAKRRLAPLLLVSLLVLFGHWMDFYLMIIPGATGNSVHFGLFEVALLTGYVGLFGFVVFHALSRASLMAFNHPFYKESLEHHT